jgi:hypothetical protein
VTKQHFGIPIEFTEGAMRAVASRQRRSAVAVIRYSAVDPGAEDGRLICVKPMLLGTEPLDVGNYGATHPTFPHQTTADQWFDESQTESYRQLGILTIRDIRRDWPGGSLADLCRHGAGTKLTAPA